VGGWGGGGGVGENWWWVWGGGGGWGFGNIAVGRWETEFEWKRDQQQPYKGVQLFKKKKGGREPERNVRKRYTEQY